MDIVTCRRNRKFSSFDSSSPLENALVYANFDPLLKIYLFLQTDDTAVKNNWYNFAVCLKIPILLRYF